ncbi:GPI transamidase component PIG-T [Podospora fimiseda]|uniref:GPI transamidase component PIG-T n=1 Tax=Podospora fimiseda TaxID=252190 RepID=A0AAN6YRB5_9PEZI|nr:GPI transamidase component PIG-T [Podospora fimiseda]
MPTIYMVLDIDRSKRPRDNPIPRLPPGHELPCNTSKSYHSHDTCFPADHEAIFGKFMKGTCPTVPPVCLQVPNSRSVYVSNGVLEKKNLDRVSRCFEISPDTNFEMVLPSPSDDD